MKQAILGLVILSYLLMSCKTVSQRTAKADEIALGYGFTKALVKTDTFLLTSYLKLQDKKQSTHIYIEGDGFAWVTKSQISLNPTPTKPMLLRLATLDPHPNVVYIARPCQYTLLREDPNCSSQYWSGKRFAPEVISSVNQAISKTIGNQDNKVIELIGYSGGGAVAILAAGQRHDVGSIRTIAGNLDHVAFSNYHHITPLSGSLNPIDVAANIATIPQYHFTGQRDTIIPVSIAEGFKNKSGDSKCISLLTVEGVSHERGWEIVWKDLLKRPLSCKAG